LNLLTYYYLDPGQTQGPGLYSDTNDNVSCSYTENITHRSLSELVFFYFEALLHRTSALITYWRIVSCYCMLRTIIWKYCTYSVGQRIWSFGTVFQNVK